MRNKKYESVLPERGSGLRAFISRTICYTLYIAMDVKYVTAATGWRRRLTCMLTLIADMTLLDYFYLYDDAVSNILELQADLQLSMETSSIPMESNHRSRKWLIRKHIRRVNKLFAFPLATFFSVLLPVVFFTFTQFFDHRLNPSESALVLVDQGCYLIQMFGIARKGSLVRSRGVDLEGFLAQQSSPARFAFHSRAEVSSVFGMREEWDAMQILGFSLDVPNFFRYLGFCISFVAVVLQFDYRVVRAMNNLGRNYTKQ